MMAKTQEIENHRARRAASPRLGCCLSTIRKKGGAQWRRHSSKSVGFFYALLRRRRESQPNPTRAEPSSVSDAGSGAATFGTKLVVKTAGNPLDSEYHRS